MWQLGVPIRRSGLLFSQKQQSETLRLLSPQAAYSADSRPLDMPIG
jgi:hypothetical protein